MLNAIIFKQTFTLCLKHFCSLFFLFFIHIAIEVLFNTFLKQSWKLWVLHTKLTCLTLTCYIELQYLT